ncbi:hypothetical protein Hanom_Chr16g01487861 [Helianthus anomalus]
MSCIKFYLICIYICLIYYKKKKKNASPLREECRHQIEGVRGVKREVDMASADWVCVREGTPLREEFPLDPNGW